MDADPVRTKVVSRSSDEVAGWGAGAGDMERVVFACPCGDGEVVEEHDNVPGFREHSVNLWCDRCRGEWELGSCRHSGCRQRQRVVQALSGITSGVQGLRVGFAGLGQ